MEHLKKLLKTIKVILVNIYQKNLKIMSNIFTKILVHIICLFNFLSVNIYSQETHSYNIEAELDIERNIIEVMIYKI